jgi:site-specific recombinase XerD
VGLVRREPLTHGLVDLPRIGEVVETRVLHPAITVADPLGVPVEPVEAFLRDLSLGDARPLTCRSYAFDLLRWCRVLWALGVSWEQATTAEVEVLVGWMRSAKNPQRQRHSGASAVNPRTGKPNLTAGYAPRTINHALSVVGRFYAFHARFGRGPVVNPVAAAPGRRELMSHRSPLEPAPVVRRAPLSQQVPQQAPRAIPDREWDALFAALGCDRDRALLEAYVSSGARASELLGIGLEDVDWSRQLLYVVSKGSRLRQPVPVSPAGLRYLVAYLADAGLPGARRAALACAARRGQAVDVLGDATGSAACQRRAGNELDPARSTAHRGDSAGE